MVTARVERFHLWNMRDGTFTLDILGKDGSSIVLWINRDTLSELAVVANMEIWEGDEDGEAE